MTGRYYREQTHCATCGRPDPPMFDGRFTDCCDAPPCGGAARERWAYGEPGREHGQLFACCLARAEEKTVGRGTMLRRIAAW